MCRCAVRKLLTYSPTLDKCVVFCCLYTILLFFVAQRHYSQLKEEFQKLKRPAEDGVAETVATSDLVPSGTTYSIAVNGYAGQTVDSVAADEIQDASSCLLPASDALSATGDTLSTAVADAAVDCDSEVTGSSSAAVA